MVAGKLFWLLAAFGTMIMCADNAISPWCTEKQKPVINMCTQEQMNNTKELYIDTVKVSKKEAKCPCIIDKINPGDIDIVIRFELLNNSHLNYGQSFYFKNDTVLNQTLLEANTTFNKKGILSFMKHTTPHPKSVGGACLHITSDRPISVECKPPDKLNTKDTTKVPPTKPSTALVTRVYNVTQRIAEDSDPFSEKETTIKPWCKETYRPVINMCKQGQMNNITELYIDTVKLNKPVFREADMRCSCIVEKANLGDLDIKISFELLNDSYLNYGQTFHFMNNAIDKENINVTTILNKRESLWFMKPKTPIHETTSGACLRITCAEPVNVECGPLEKLTTTSTTTRFTKVSPTKPSTVLVTRGYNVTQKIAEETNPISEIVLPIGVTMAMLFVVLVVIILSISRYRSKRRGHCKTETQPAEHGSNAVELMTDKVDEKEHYAEPNDNKKYEEVDIIEGASNAARGTNNAMPIDKTANEYGFIMKDGPSNSTYDHVQRTKAHQKYTDNIYNTFKDTDPDNDTYKSTNASMALNNKTTSQNAEENVYHVLEKQ